jgi:hypothetical protein
MIDDPLHASVAAALIQAGLSFQTSVGKTATERIVRVFQVPFDLPHGGRTCLVTAYSAGILFIAVAPLRLLTDRPKDMRHEMMDFLITRKGLVRLRPDVSEADLIWVEAAVPLPSTGGPIDAFVAVAPFSAVASAVEAVRAQFPDSASIADVPLIPIVEALDTDWRVNTGQQQ